MSDNSEYIIEIFKDFIKTFVRKDKQYRLSLFLDKKKRWRNLTDIEFHHSGNFDDAVLVAVKPDTTDNIYEHMRSFGAKEKCYSLLDYLDGEEYECNLYDKLYERTGTCIETVLFCPDSRTGYFEGGHAKDRYILKRP